MFFWQSGLYRDIHSDQNLWNAWRAVKANNGNASADGVSLISFERTLLANLKDLQERLARRDYRPGPPKVFEIPKENGGKRPIAVLSIADRVVERALHQALCPVVEPHFHPASHAFRPGRSTRTAIEHLVRLAGPRGHWLGHVDIEACFASLAHGHLLRQLRRFVRERAVRHLIRAFIDGAPNGSSDPRRGVLQGGALLSGAYPALAFTPSSMARAARRWMPAPSGPIRSGRRRPRSV